MIRTALDRRSFLQSTSALLAAGALARPHAAHAAETKIVVGAHPWVYAATQPKYDITPVLAEIFADMRYAGMDGVELMHTALHPDDAVSRIRELSEEHHLPVLGTSFGGAMWDRAKRNEVLEDAERVIMRLAKLGGRTLGTSVGPAPAPKTPQQLDDQADVLRKIMKMCAAHGVTLNLHNHTYEVENDQHDLRGTLERVPDVKLGPDLNWLLRGGVDPVAFIKKHGSRIVFLHLRDQRADGVWSEAMGEGDMDYAAIAQALRDIPFQGVAVIELAHPQGFKITRPLRESLRISREFVRKTLGY